MRKDWLRGVIVVGVVLCSLTIVPEPVWAASFYVAVGGGAGFQGPLGSSGGTDISAIGGIGETSITREAVLAGFVEGFPYDLFAHASADLGSGHLKIKAEALGAGFASANARFGDRLYFSGPFNGCGAGTVADPYSCYTIGFGMTLSGSFSGLGNPAPPFATFFATNGFDTFGFQFDLFSVLNGPSTKSGTYNAYALTNYSIGLDVRLNDYGVNAVNGFYDFSNTAAVTIDLPPGVTFASDSGAFLQNAPQAVPEASPLYLLGAGIAALGFRARLKTATTI